MRRPTTTPTKSHEVFENVVASVVDVTSIMVAYTIGITQSSFFLGLAYGVFDAVIVVWMRKPITRAVRRIMRVGSEKSSSDQYTSELVEELPKW